MYFVCQFIRYELFAKSSSYFQTKPKSARVERHGVPILDGIEINTGEQMTGVRIVLVYADGTLTLHGELKVVGGALPADCGFFVYAHGKDQKTKYSGGEENTDSRGHFVFDNLVPGEYEIEVVPNPRACVQLSPELRERFASVKRTVVVASDNQQPVILVVDLSRKEGK